MEKHPVCGRYCHLGSGRRSSDTCVYCNRVPNFGAGHSYKNTPLPTGICGCRWGCHTAMRTKEQAASAGGQHVTSVKASGATTLANWASVAQAGVPSTVATAEQAASAGGQHATCAAGMRSMVTRVSTATGSSTLSGAGNQGQTHRCQLGIWARWVPRPGNEHSADKPASAGASTSPCGRPASATTLRCQRASVAAGGGAKQQ